jgi:Tol biopolymer transport system component
MRTRSRSGRSWSRLIVAGLGACLLVSAWPSLAHATFGGPNGKIAFSTIRNGSDRDIWIMNPDGSNPENVTAGAPFASSNEDWPVWNRDGTKLAFHTDLHGPTEIYAIELDGTSPPLHVTYDTLGTEFSDAMPTWSPDGQWIAYTRCFSASDCNIYKRLANGSNPPAPVPLTEHPQSDIMPAWDTGGGGTIAFISNRTGVFQLHIMDSNGNNETTQVSNQEEYNPNWDPGATKLIFDRNVGGEFDVVSRNYDGSGCCLNWNPANDPFFDIEPTWSPDGTQIAWSNNRFGNWEIASSFDSNLTENAAEDRHSDWGVLAPKIVVVKNSIPDDGQDFVINPGGGLNSAPLVLDDDSNGTQPNTRTLDYVPPGSGYSLTESAVSGWDQTSATCSDGSPVTNISVQHFETVTCTFTNTKRGTIKIRKNTDPDGPTDFSYTDNIPGCTIGPLDDDADGTNPNETSCSVAPGSYTVTEADSTPAFDLTGLSCDDTNSTGNVGSRTASISLQAGETVTCTFTNRQRGKLIITKDTVPDDPQDFTFSAGGGLTPSSFTLDDDPGSVTPASSIIFDHVAPGSGYSVSETLPGPWLLADARCDDGSTVQNIAIGPAETVTCAFTNARPYVRPRGATPFRAAFVIAHQPCVSPNRQHGPPLAHPSCTPPAQSSAHLTAGTPDANLTATNFFGHALFHADADDVSITTSLTDVRNKSSLSDYTGEVQLSVPVQITDRHNENGVNLNGPGTSHAELKFTIPCTATAESIGASCSVATSVNAVYPGAVIETKRAVWQFEQIRVFDGGADGDAETAGDNTLFATQGVFVP